MFGHFPELVIILVLALVVFGPEKMPELAANAGKFVREMRQALDVAMNPIDVDVPEDFSTYYEEEMAHSGEEVPDPEEEVLPHQEYYDHLRAEGEARASSPDADEGVFPSLSRPVEPEIYTERRPASPAVRPEGQDGQA